MPEFEDESTLYANMYKKGSTIEYSVDAIRPIEVMFQPYIVGNDQVDGDNSRWDYQKRYYMYQINTVEI